MSLKGCNNSFNPPQNHGLDISNLSENHLKCKVYKKHFFKTPAKLLNNFAKSKHHLK
jgi:hypothetical protein